MAQGPERRANSAPWGSEVGSLLGPFSGHNVLDRFTVWLTDREQWLAEGMGSWPTGWGAASLSKGLVLTTWPATLAKKRASSLEEGAGHPVGTSAIPLYLMSLFPHITDCYHLSTILSEQNSRNAGLDPLPYFLTSCVTQLSDSPSKTLLFHFGFRERVPLRNVTVICLPLPDEC